LAATRAADYHGQALQLGIAQQFDGREERVHVEVRDATGRGSVRIDRRDHARKDSGVIAPDRRAPRGSTPDAASILLPQDRRSARALARALRAAAAALALRA